MSLQSIIEQSIKNLDSLPAAVQKNMMKIRRLDAICQRMNLDAQVKVRQLIDSWKTLSKDQRKKSLDALKADFHRIGELSEEKIHVSERTYELVDKYIIKLDNDTCKLNAAVRRKFGVEEPSVEVEAGTRKRRGGGGRPSGKRMKRSELLWNGETSTGPLVDMPVDPDEPTYCTCRQVSYGQMVMCDNNMCPIEWYHFTCVGIESNPRGRWYCDLCADLRRRR